MLNKLNKNIAKKFRVGIMVLFFIKFPAFIIQEKLLEKWQRLIFPSHVLNCARTPGIKKSALLT